MLLVRLPVCLQIPLPMLLRLEGTIPDASLLAATLTRCAPRVPTTALPAVGMEVGGIAPPPLQEVGLVGSTAPPPHHVVGLVGLCLLPLGGLLPGPQLLPLDGRALTSFLGCLAISPPRPDAESATAPDAADTADGWNVPSPPHNPIDTWGFPDKDEPPPSAVTALAA